MEVRQGHRTSLRMFTAVAPCPVEEEMTHTVSPVRRLDRGIALPSLSRI